MTAKIIIYNRISKEDYHELKRDYRVSYYDQVHPLKHQPFLDDLRTADGIIGLDLPVGKQLLELAPKLKIVSNISTGYDNLDISAMTSHNVMATNTPGVLEETTADAIFGLLLATARRIPELDTFVKKGHWKNHLTPEHYGMDVHHKTIGIIGMGTIGSLIAKRAHCGFDMNVLYHNRSRRKVEEEKFHATYCELDSLLEESDFICLMTPLTSETRYLIGREAFRKMKDTAIFINGSRGATVDELALEHALKEKEILAAGLDVFHEEPVPSSHPILQFKNVVTTPHIGSSTHETERNMSKLAVKNLRAGLNGEIPPCLINKELFNTSN